MKDNDTKTKFMELRAKNVSFETIALELKVSKQTLISWSKDLTHAIGNLRAIENEELQQKYFAVSQKRIELFGKALQRIQSELEGRDLKEISTEKLFILQLRYIEALKGESSETSFSRVDDGAEALLTDVGRVSTWRA